LFAVSMSFAQFTREEKLQQLKSRQDIKVTEVEKDLLKLEYPNGKVMYKNISDYRLPVTNNLVYSPTFDSTIIDLTTIDTTLYYQKYSFWQEVNVGSPYTARPLIGDVNNNSLPEIYGMMKNYNTEFSDVVVMEMNLQSGFDSVYCYDSTNNPRAIYDIDKDGMEEVPFRRYPSDTLYPGHSWLFFKKTSDKSLATELSFIFHPFSENNQLDGNTFGDWDGDAFTDQIFIRPCCPPTINIFEYNPVINNFDSIYQYDFSSLDNFYHGFIIGDFDQDSNTEFFAGSVNGKVISIENCGDNCYTPNWQGMVETNNAYLYAATDDLDSNGKPEVWIGGYHFWNGEAITRITIFEASGNNNYVAVGKIDIIGAFNFYAKNMQVLDVDKDGKEEVMMCIEQHVMILKFNGSINHHSYEVFYIKRNDLAFSGRNSVFYGATMYDVTNDGKEDIVIHLDDIITNVGMRLFTFIYKADFSVDVNEHHPLPEKFHLYPNYPNPFNPATNIRFEIPEYSFVSIKVYNVLGKEITTLLEKEISPGSHTIDWEAKDSNNELLASGVYLIKLTAGKYTHSVKAVLLK
ncbi:T9SS type A sorting domain-containing protein, partial [Ignavibacterium sp.]|uniref:T9SS type A sorting domain-containing protein n=1 Tax=Ignavibacterium sp. TaxID=2651167 RepID=UPI00307E36D6